MVVFRYLIKHIVLTMLAVAAVLLLVVMGSKVIRYISDAAAGELPLALVGRLVMYQMPGFLQLILPLAFFLGILLAYGQLYLNSEMTVLRACGISPAKVLRVSLWPAAVVAVIVALCSLWYGPQGKHLIAEALYKQQQQADFSVLSPGRFRKLGEKTLYAESISDGNSRLKNVFVIESQKIQGEPTEVITRADSGYQVRDEHTGSRYLVLADGERYAAEAGKNNVERLKFASYAARLQDSLKQYNVDELDARPTAQLFADPSPKAQGELQWRWSLALMVPILTLLAMSLSKVDPRQGRFARLLPAIVLHIVYLSLLLTVQSFIGSERIPASIGVWPVHVAFLLLGVWLLRRTFSQKGQR